jgi:hypothetical protein
MTNRERLIAALEGKRPDIIPITVNEQFVQENPSAEWEELYKRGLCMIPYVGTVMETATNVEHIRRTEMWKGRQVERQIMRTPVGEISQVLLNGWVQEFFLKTPEDYRVMEYIIRNMRIVLWSQSFIDTENQLGDNGITLIGMGRTPMQTIMVDYVGLEEFAFHLADGFPELFSLQEALLDQLIERSCIIAKGPGRYVSLLENLTSECWGPDRFAKYHIPVYEKIIPILHAGGKRVYSHCDGKLKCLAGLLNQTGIDGIESLTPPPEGDMTYGEAREAMPGKVFWANINVSDYSLPPEELRKRVIEFVHQASPDGHSLAFEISEDCPPNWRESIPVVLETLAEI